MDNFTDFVTRHTRSPTYLVELLGLETDIILVRKKVQEESFASLEDSLQSTMNLTGTPLETDLDVLPSSTSSNIPFCQNLEDAKYLPMKLISARKFLNHYNKIHSRETSPKHIYCVCDGSDEKNTVILGSHLLNGVATRTLVFSEGCVDETCPKNHLDYMISEHVQNVGGNNSKVKTKVTCLYELYGCKLAKNCLLESVENAGSVLIDATWNSLDYDIPQQGATIQMMLQAIIGHEKSIVYPFFQELSFLQQCLNVLHDKQGNLDDSTISHNPVKTTNLTKRISEILNEVCVVKEPSVEPDDILSAIQNIEDTSLLDKLWTILKCCGKVSDVQVCFTQLFDAAYNTSLRLQLFGNDESTAVGKMISDVCASRLMVNLSSKQSLELLIELGLQKLKRKYFSIIKSYGFFLTEQLEQNWNEIGSSVVETKRQTFAEISLKKGFSQLRYLLCVHILLEFLQLVEQNCCFSKEVCINIAKQAFNKYVMDQTSVELFSMGERKQLCDLMVPLTFMDVKVIQGCSPLKWQLKIISVEKYSSVTTVFHYSKYPIFPEMILHNGDADADTSSIDTSEKFYFYRLKVYSNKIY